MKKSDLLRYFSFVLFFVSALILGNLIFDFHDFGGSDVFYGYLILFLTFIAIISYFISYKIKLTKEDFIMFLIGEVVTIIFIGFIGIILAISLFSKEWNFFFISFVFLSLGAFVEGFAMFNLLIKKKQSVKKTLASRIIYGILWVHGVVYFIKKTSTTIYGYKKLGFLPLAIAYFIIFFYIALAYFLLRYSIWGTLIYLIPVFTNLAYILKYDYMILNRKK